MRPSLIQLGSGISILGAFVAIILLAIEACGRCNIASMLCLVLIAVLFFAIAGNFYHGGISKSMPMALILVVINIAIIIASFAVENAFGIAEASFMVLLALIPGLIAVAEAKWFELERI